MNLKLLTTILFLWTWVSVTPLLDESDDVIEKFVATSEWADIKEGQSIGKGLHVRMNLETGRKEAKKLSKEDSESSGVGENRLAIKDASIVDLGIVDDSLDVEKLEEGLKRAANSDDSSETLSGRFRTIEELKKEMPNLKMQTEGEVLKDKMSVLSSTSDTDIPSLIIVLEELEDLAHKYDNGQLLVTQGWMKRVGELLFHPSEEVYKAVLRVISSATQSNPPVQVHCIQAGYLGTLISRLLSQSEKLAKSTIFAISSMVRNMPAALDAFKSLHGYNTLSTKLAVSTLGPLQRAILTFYNDILEQDVQLKSDAVITQLKPRGKVLVKKYQRYCPTVIAVWMS
ncbi:nucleotide exchange factor SIL1-like [Bolinopsis microptera]|uniref:nucleotide exchange factor SIL1-like n=1 Tax=Bolinopsis microptera TaxID=2820187 RepID=UPI00307966FF